MGKYIFLRVLNYIILLTIAVNLSYFLAATQLHPRILYELLNPPLDPASIDASLTAYNLNDKTPLVQRWWTWLTNVVVHWDWGQEPKGGAVNDEVARRAFVSLRLITIGSVLGIGLGVLIGAWTAVRQYKVSDRITTVISLLLISTPSFVVATLLIIVATKFNLGTGMRVFEFTGETGDHGTYFAAPLMDRLQHLLLPTVALVLFGIAGFSRIQRNLMLDALGADYVRTARAKGLRQGKAVMKHALRTSLIPTATFFAFSVATLFVGSATMERVFSFQGMGIYGVTTISGQDVNGTVAVTAFSGVCVLVGAMLADVMVAALDPRVRLS